MTRLGPEMLLLIVLGCLMAAFSGQISPTPPALSEKLDNFHGTGNSTSEFGKKSVRLVTGTSSCNGTLQVKISGSWHPVCKDSWSNMASLAVCRELSCWKMEPIESVAGTPAPEEPKHLPVGNWSVTLNDTWAFSLRSVTCDKGEWKTCKVQSDVCSNGTPTKVNCEEVHAVRLMDGGSRCAGRVELKDKGSWGTVCDDAWDLNDAMVVCQQLGCGRAVDIPGASVFQKGKGPIHLDEVNCSGTELSLWECPAQRDHDCHHKEDAGVVCSDSLSQNTSWIPEVTSNSQLPTAASPVPLEIQKNEFRERILLILCIVLGILLLAALLALTFIFLKIKGKYALPVMKNHNQETATTTIGSNNEVSLTIPKEEDSQKYQVTEEMAQQNRFRMPTLQEDHPVPAPQNYQRYNNESSTSSGEDYCNSPTSKLPQFNFQGFPSESKCLLKAAPNLELAGSRATLLDASIPAPQNHLRHNSESSTSSGEGYCNSSTGKLSQSNFQGFSSERNLLEPTPNLELAGSRATLLGTCPGVVSAAPAAEDSSSTSSGEWYENYDSPQPPPLVPFGCPDGGTRLEEWLELTQGHRTSKNLSVGESAKAELVRAERFGNNPTGFRHAAFISLLQP